MEKGKAGDHESKSVTGTYEILVIPKVVAEGARGQFHNFRDVPKSTQAPGTQEGSGAGVLRKLLDLWR